MASLKDYFELAAPEYIPLGLTALITGFVFSSNSLVFPLSFAYAFLSILFLLAGYLSFNAVSDKQIDAINKPYRPIPRGAITSKHSFYVSILFFSISLALAFLVNPAFFGIVTSALLLSLLYSFPGVNLKRRFGLGSVCVNLLYTVFIPLAGWAIFPANPVPWALVSFLFFFGLGTAVLKDFEDVPGDMKYGARTLPGVLGYKESIIFVFSSYLFSMVVLLFFIFQNSFSLKYVVMLIPILLAMYSVYRLYRVHTPAAAKKAVVKGMLIMMFTELGFAALALVN